MILNKKLENYWLILQSLPSRECGYTDAGFVKTCVDFVMSLPSRECGYTDFCEVRNFCLKTVAPFAGVWIYCITRISAETGLTSLPSRECGYTELRSHQEIHRLQSLPSRECGLKLWLLILTLWTREVAPFAGVWIEISYWAESQARKGSLPSRECGLKCVEITWYEKDRRSLPSRECGLKL